MSLKGIQNSKVPLSKLKVIPNVWAMMDYPVGSKLGLWANLRCKSHGLKDGVGLCLFLEGGLSQGKSFRMRSKSHE